MDERFNPDIWRLQTQVDTSGLVEQLSNEDPGIRKRAVAALRALGAFSAIDSIEAALEQEPDAEVRSIMLSALATMRQEKDRKDADPRSTAEIRAAAIDPEMQKLLDGLDSEDAATVIRVAGSLGDKGDKVAVEPLVMIFNNPETPIKIRLAVAEALLKLESAPVEVALLGAMRNPDWRVRRNSAAILGQLKASWAVEPIVRALRDENATVRRTAYAALKAIDTPEAKRAVSALKAARQRKMRATQEAEAIQAAIDNVIEDKTDTGKLDPSKLEQKKAAQVQQDVTDTHRIERDEDKTGTQPLVQDNTETQRISWPKTDNLRQSMATAPLNPDIYDEARRRAEEKKKQAAQNDAANDSKKSDDA